ncbi:MAG: N-acetylmuramoyl-L-alanine amidase [Lewinellaceae bacterium]|nr:N-acetylmuramoyl-L-alanine amidase [Lewinellaceae bacterium]
MNTDFLVLLDAGHGALDPMGFYTTSPGKMFRHNQGVFHGGGWFYEGVFNRSIADRVALKLGQLNIRHVRLYHPYLDVSLAQRVEKANWYHRYFPQALLLSTHANSSPNHNARGFELYTTPGRTQADQLADLHWENVKLLLGNKITMRSDRTDNDYDKEANFYILRKTSMPAVLVEHLFFDQFDDATLLIDEEIVELFAEAQVRTIIQYFNA